MFSLNFFMTPSGREPVREWLRDLNKEDRGVIGADLRTVQMGFPLGMPVCRPIGSGLYEVRSSLPSKREARVLFFQDGPALIVLGGFIKKSGRTPQDELDLARQRLAEYVRNKAHQRE